MINKELYRDFYNQHTDICIFSSPWWLDTAVGENNWDVILVRNKEDEIIASFSYAVKKSFGKNIIFTPVLTQKLGPYIVYDEETNTEYKRIEYENHIFEQIIHCLPEFSFFSINFDCVYKNWLEFYWHGFNQTTRYTYRINNLKEQNWFENFEKSKKKKIKKGEKTFEFKTDLPANVFYDFFESVIKNRKEEVSYSKEQFCKIYDAVYEQNAGKSFYCLNKENNDLAAIKFIIWDSTAAYDLIGIRKKEYNTAGATEYLTFECIKYVSQFVDIFDFEGSMIKGVEDAYRGYGTVQTEYYSITKDNRLLRPLLRDCKHVMMNISKQLYRCKGGGKEIDFELTELSPIICSQGENNALCA